MSDLAKIRENNRTNYIIMFVLSVIFLVIAAYTANAGNLIIAVPTLILSIVGIKRNERLILPVTFIIMVAISMTLIQLSNMLKEDRIELDIISNLFFGVFTCILGLLIVLALMKSSPSFDIQRPFFVSFTAFCISVSLSLFLIFGEYAVDYTTVQDDTTKYEDFMIDMGWSMLGSVIVSILFYMNRHNGLFEHTLNRFLKNNSDILGVGTEQDRAIAEISKGESSRLEFKSTLRLNLKTGEKDPRMERAVLKTLVAYLNSKGGVLYIGVGDDASLLGVDLESFDNSKDKFGLHLNNLIVKQIGGELLPFIHYDFIELGEKPIMRVECQRSKRPVFLTDGKEQTFFVRSGPSTIELHGMELLQYVNYNFGKIKMNKSGFLNEID